MPPLFETLILHIGSHKTGTSAIQSALQSAHEALLEHGVLYPKTGQWHDHSHHHWALSLWGKPGAVDDIDGLLTALTHERDITGVSPHTVILSTEMIEKVPLKAPLCAALSQMLGSLAQRTEIVYFVRRQDLLLESVFKQWVKDNSVRLSEPFAAFVQTYKTGMYYPDILAAWERIKGVSKVHVRTNALRSDPVKAFEAVTTPPVSLTDAGAPTKIVNPSLDGAGLELKHFLNALNLSTEEDMQLLRIINRVGLPKEKLALLTEPERTAIIEEFAPINRRLEERYETEPFDLKFPTTDRMFQPLKGQTLQTSLHELGKIDPKLTWKIYDKMRRAVQRP